MADEPTLPRLSAPPAVSWNAQTQSFNGRGANFKKRTRDNETAPPLFSNSSDPAFFSSDDDPALENYLQGKRKKQKNVGSWFSQHPATTHIGEATTKTKRTLERHLDSGVWLGSDGTDGTDTEESADFLPPRPAQSKMPELQPRQRKGLQRVESLRISSAEQTARQKIQECIDNGTEDVDLSYLYLDSLSNATIEPLKGFSCIPLVTEDVDFEQKTPSLRLYLGNNQLTRLPGSLFSIDFLTFLSLRGNQLQELPSCIGKLRNLKSLNISMNLLNYLPAELLDLMMGPVLEEVQMFPNPYCHWDMAHDDLANNNDIPLPPTLESQHQTTEPRVRAGIMGRTDVQLFDSKGRTGSAYTDSAYELPPHSETEIPLAVRGIWIQIAEQRNAISAEPRVTKVPSLMELALRHCSSSAELPDLPDLLPDDSPPFVSQILSRALDQREAGGLRCSECDGTMVTPSARWLEFWSLEMSATHHLLPFMKQACSSMCAAAYKRIPGE